MQFSGLVQKFGTNSTTCPLLFKCLSESAVWKHKNVCLQESIWSSYFRWFSVWW